MEVFWFLALGMFLYLFPFFIAMLRGHNSAAAIFVLTLFVGWTGLGWLIALIWSLTGNVRGRAGASGSLVVNVHQSGITAASGSGAERSTAVEAEARRQVQQAIEDMRRK